MLVVSNTSPILNLAIVDQLHLLQEQFQEVLIPSEVLDELKIDEERPGSSAIAEAISAGWIQVREINNELLIQVLKRTLDDGEAAAITLASEMKANLILIDERDGRRVAKSLGLQVTGVLGILLRAKQTNKLESVQPIIEKLITLAGFRISPNLLKQF